MRIIGIDPGSRITGYGVIEVDGNSYRHLASGCLHIGDLEVGARLKEIFCGVRDVLGEFQPQAMAVEKVFVQRNVDSALKLGQARGAAICAGAMSDLPIFEYSPNKIKQTIVGKGHAAKEQVQHMVRILLNLRESPASDAADALACALCHGQIARTMSRYSAAEQVALAARWRGTAG